MNSDFFFFPLLHSALYLPLSFCSKKEDRPWNSWMFLVHKMPPNVFHLIIPYSSNIALFLIAFSISIKEIKTEAMNFLFIQTFITKNGKVAYNFSNQATAAQCDKQLMKSNISFWSVQITTRKIHRHCHVTIIYTEIKMHPQWKLSYQKSISIQHWTVVYKKISIKNYENC